MQAPCAACCAPKSPWWCSLRRGWMVGCVKFACVRIARRDHETWERRRRQAGLPTAPLPMPFRDAGHNVTLCAGLRWFSPLAFSGDFSPRGTPILWRTFGVTRTLYTERHVHGTPILCTWHTHIMAQFTHPWRSEGGARCGRVSVKARRCGLHVPRDGSGEPARA